MVTRIQNRTNQVPAQQDIPYRTMQPSTEGNEIIVNSLLNEPSTQKEKSRTQMFLDSKYYKYGTFCFQIFLLAGVVTAIILSQTHYHLLPSVMSTPPQLVAPTSPLPMISPPLQFHHAFFHLKSSGYTDLEGVNYLHWKKDESQNVGNFQLVNETCVFVPQDGIYEISYAVQLLIPKDTLLAVVTLMFQKKNNEEDYVFMKKSCSSLDMSQYTIMQSSFTYQLKANDTIVLRMNKAGFISRNTPSGYLSITSLHIKTQ
ncbi:uncharacterized protein LOC106878338 isoform X1 [Octopus bimaculoides]|uniref:TNF family profile domain-containing protein n=1 Tax=Octopus bimaculoides TaxID=37653 RepID=A0A0L8G9I3_OCTBM|nr:uncharacterized protein LOC106878338 isoform X1 [Octopus bimaculoides]|eukprot:XP_014783019.1 PREDICTED: uncharacterized protein LOC106878338 [Octopus bimaculoides]